MEAEIFSADVQVRKLGEKRYGKGKIRITDKSVNLSFKKLIGKLQEFEIARNDIVKVEFRDRELPFEIVGPGHPIGSDQSWITLEIILNDGNGFTIYVGQPRYLTSNTREKYMEKFRKIYEILKD